MTAFAPEKWHLFENLLLDVWPGESARCRRLGLPQPRMPQWSDIAGASQTHNNKLAAEQFCREWPMAAAAEVLGTSQRMNRWQQRLGEQTKPKRWPDRRRHVPVYTRDKYRVTHG